uniref:Retrovirus-related Pol polyprotein from transposon TNT 1-94 n=1 Tax=Tanacetum cinerariifolium TaxID=118510 RepID=A0A699HYZ3_TANCI|nr:retrovirus-related Pol polyprotein from transposon TNT 1-94 [Tanacetum cinerariifolium]
MELYMMNRQHGKIILEYVENGPLIWPSIEENGVTRPKKYSELSATEAIQANCDVKATKIILQGLPPEVYALVSNHKVAKELWERIYLLMQGTSLTKQERKLHHNVYTPSSSIPQVVYPPSINQQPNFSQPDSGLIVQVFQKGDDPIDAINHMMSFLIAIVTSRYPSTNNHLRNSPNPQQQATINNGRVTVQPIQGRHTSLAAGTSRTYTSGTSGNNFRKQMTVICYNCKREGHMSKQCIKPKRERDEPWFKDKLKPHRMSSPIMLFIKPMIWMPMTLIVMKSILPKLHSWRIYLHYGSDDLAEVVQIVLWYLDSGCSKHMTGDRSQLTNFVNKFLGTVTFGNDHVATIMGYGDYQIGNVTISRVYFVEGLGNNLFSVGQFCDSDLEVAFRQHTCFICNLKGVDLLTGSLGNNLYTLSLGDMMASSPICILSKALKTKSWLWHRRLSHLNFGVINPLARQALVRGLPMIKLEKDHRCSACAMGKSKKKSHKPKSKDTNQEKLYLLHMDLCGPMRVESVNGKKYILIIDDDYSRFTWVKCLRSKDEALNFIIKFLKMIQVGISHETSVAHSSQQNSVIKRRNRTLIEATHIMLIYAQAPLFLWAEAVATACYTQNHSIVRLHHGKTPYELLHGKLPDLSFLYVFGALCYPTNDSEILGKLQPKANICIFIGYAPTKKAFQIYNQRTRRIIKTIHVDFDELIAMASEQSSSGPALHEMTLTTISSGLVPKPTSSTPPEVIAPIAEVVAPEPVVSTSSPFSTTVDQDAQSPSKSQTTLETQPPVVPIDVEEDNHDIEVVHMGDDLFFGMPILEVSSDQSSSADSIHTIMHPDHQISEHNSKWTKDHLLENIIGQLTRPVSTRLQLHEQALFCYYYAFLTSVEPKTYKDALTQSCWIEAMQEELNEFKSLEV